MNVRPVRPNGARPNISKTNARSIYLTAKPGRNGGRAISRQTRLVRPDHAVSLEGTARISAMKALVLSSLSGPDALSIQEFPEPAVKTGQTLVRVSAGGLNFADVMTTKGGYP